MQNNSIDIFLHTSTEESIVSQRDRKGKYLIDFPDKYCVVDIETTGLSPAYNSIIEISALKIESGEVVDSFSSLVKPDIDYGDGIYVDDFIANLTGITNDMLSSAPDTADVIASFKVFLQDEIIVGHNVSFDINFLYDNMMKYLDSPLENDYIDTMRIAMRIHKELKHYKLRHLAKLYNIDYESAHRALRDCEITNQCFMSLKQDVLKMYSDIDSFKKSTKYTETKSKDIAATASDFDETSILYNKVIVFTGTLEKMTRKEAMQIVANIGGINGDSITSKTNFLVLGNNDYSKIKDGKSNKQKKAEKLKLDGQDIEIIPENVFYDMINEYI